MALMALGCRVDRQGARRAFEDGHCLWSRGGRWVALGGQGWLGLGSCTLSGCVVGAGAWASSEDGKGDQGLKET